MKRWILAVFLAITFGTITHAETYQWLHDLTFDTEEGGRVVYNSRDRLEMMWYDMSFIIQIYSNHGVNDDILKQNLQRRASSYNMYDTRTEKYKRNSFKGFCLTGTLPDGSKAEICNIVSEKSGLCLQLIVNYTSASEKMAKKLLKSFKQKQDKQKQKPKKKKKQKVGKKNAPQKPIKKSSISPAELYEI